VQTNAEKNQEIHVVNLDEKRKITLTTTVGELMEKWLAYRADEKILP